MSGIPAPALPESDRIGLTCAACHTGSIRYQDVSIRFDGGAAMLDLRKLERASGLAIFYTLIVPGRFERFANRVLGPGADKAKKDELKKGLKEVADFLKNQIEITQKTLKAKGQKDTDEGFGRLDALNRIGNQVFYVDFAASGLSDYANNLHANDAPVSFPPVWTVPWLWWAQYDASIEQPLIRNAGEALGVSALVNHVARPSDGKAFQLFGRPGKSGSHRGDVARSGSVWPRSQGVRRAFAAEMAGASVPQR